jgi:adenosine deaminase
VPSVALSQISCSSRPHVPSVALSQISCSMCPLSLCHRSLVQAVRMCPLSLCHRSLVQCALCRFVTDLLFNVPSVALSQISCSMCPLSLCHRSLVQYLLGVFSFFLFFFFSVFLCGSDQQSADTSHLAHLPRFVQFENLVKQAAKTALVVTNLGVDHVMICLPTGTKYNGRTSWIAYVP